MSEKLLTIFRMAIAARDIPKKKLARRCKISRPYLSLMIHGDKPMPEKVKQRLIEELELESILEKFEIQYCEGKQQSIEGQGAVA